MPIQLQDVANLLASITLLCFSFCIPVIAIWFRKAAPLPKLLGLSFIPVFLFCLASLFITDYTLSLVLSQTAEPILLLLFTLFLIGKRLKWKTSILQYGLFLLPAGIFAAAIFSITTRTILSDRLTSVTITIAVSILLLYLLKNGQSGLNTFFWAILPIMAATLAQFYLTTGILSFAAPALRLGAYITLLYYFYQAFYGELLQKVAEAEKKLATCNRYIDYEVKKRILEIGIDEKSLSEAADEDLYGSKPEGRNTASHRNFF